MIMMKCHRINEHKKSTMSNCFYFYFYCSLRFLDFDLATFDFYLSLFVCFKIPDVYQMRFYCKIRNLKLFFLLCFVSVWPFQSTLQFEFLFTFLLFETILFYAEDSTTFCFCNILNFFFRSMLLLLLRRFFFLSHLRAEFYVNLSPLLDIIINRRNHHDVQFYCMHFSNDKTRNFLLYVNNFFSLLFFCWTKNKINISLFRFVS